VPSPDFTDRVLDRIPAGSTVCCYVALPGEPPTAGLIEALLARGDAVYLPVASGDDSTTQSPDSHRKPQPANPSGDDSTTQRPDPHQNPPDPTTQRPDPHQNPPDPTTQTPQPHQDPAEPTTPRPEPHHTLAWVPAAHSRPWAAWGVAGSRCPVPAQPLPEPDVIIVPALAVDAAGRRLGQGGGYYDRFVPHHPRARTIALLWSGEVLPDVGAEPHDITVAEWVLADG
jgi:5-formyltetrahydrofolate cyclo-ligase